MRSFGRSIQIKMMQKLNCSKFSSSSVGTNENRPMIPSGTHRLSKSILSCLPESAQNESLWGYLHQIVSEENSNIIVLDDDPTGCQTVYNINVLLDYSIHTIKKQLQLDHKLFFILTNTRAKVPSEAEKIIKEVMYNIRTAREHLNYNTKHLRFVSRGDSTLRGHFPLETNLIKGSTDYDGVILCPAFFEGGRVTLGDVHYLTEKDELIPVGESSFAKDAHFGYNSSNLVEWVMEKTNLPTVPLSHHISKDQIVSISIEDIRQGGSEHIANILDNLIYGAVIIVNAIHEHDLNTFMLGLIQAESYGHNFIYRTAASFVASRVGLPPIGLISFPKSATDKKIGGLIVVGSYVPKTTAQLSVLTKKADIIEIELSVKAILDLLHKYNNIPSIKYNFMIYYGQSIPMQVMIGIHELINNVSLIISQKISAGSDVVLSTSREFVEHASLEDTSFVSSLITEIISKISIQPSFLIAKGGITSHDVALKGLEVKTAKVLGQVEPGVPVWQVDENSKFPNLDYIVFPGNVGDEEALFRVAQRLGVKGKDISDNQNEKILIDYDMINKEMNRIKQNDNSLFSLLQTYQACKLAIAGFNVYNLEGAIAVVSAAELTNTSVILQVHPASLHFGGKAFLAMLLELKKNSSIPVFIHLDHIEHENDVKIGLEYGVDSIMIDGSAKPFEENLKWTKEMASLIHHGKSSTNTKIIVEAELGRLGGEEDGLSVALRDAKMTDPFQARIFVTETNIDMLAVTIGNVHGKYSQPPNLDFDRLGKIRSAVCLNGRSTMPLVLHGASGLPKGLLYKAMDYGVCKFNVNTDLRNAAMSSMKGTILHEKDNNQAKTDVLSIMKETTYAMQQVAINKINMFRRI
eukprot:gene4643-6525_t